jgi:thiamine pyrophosphate-dependent acetolactate synthase large subunit-like protein
MARSFGMASARITHKDDIDGVIQAAFKEKAPILIEVNTSLDAMLP